MIRERNGRLEVIVYLGRDPDGKRRSVSRTVTGTNRVAWRKAQAIEVELRATPLPSGDMTVGELFTAWLAVARKEQSGHHKAERDYRLYLKPRLGSIRLSKLTVAQIDGTWVHLEQAGSVKGGPLSPSTVDGAHRTLSAALSQAVVWGLIPTNPAVNATRPRIAEPDPEPPTRAEVQLLLTTAAADKRTVDLGVFLRISASTGSRRGEVCGLRWSDIDFERHTLRRMRAAKQVKGLVYVADTKTRVRTGIALGPATVELLKAHLARKQANATFMRTRLGPDAYVFSNDPDGATPWAPRSVTQRFEYLRKRCELEHVRLKELRHFSATALFEEGVPAKVVSGRLSHSRTSTTHDIYAAWSPVADRAAAGILDDLLDG